MHHRIILGALLAFGIGTVQAHAGQPVTITDATNTQTAHVDSGGLHVICDTGCSGGNSAIYGAPFVSVQTGGTLGSSGVFSSVLASNGARHSCLIQNTSTDTEYVYFGSTGSATTANSFSLVTGATISCAGSDTTVATDNVAMAGKTSGSDTYVVQSK